MFKKVLLYKTYKFLSSCLLDINFHHNLMLIYCYKGLDHLKKK